MPSIDAALQWYKDRINKVYYSMTYRNGQMINADGVPVSSGGRPGFDCSSSMYYALKQGGFLPANLRIGNTDSLYGDLETNGWEKLQLNANGEADVQAGDVFIWGKRGASAGAFGHTGGFIDTAGNIIHCSYGYNGIHEDPHDWLWEINGEPPYTFYRYTGKTSTPPSIQGSPTDQVLEVGSTIKFDKTYTVDDIQYIDDLWQVRTNALCNDDFSWQDNGLPVQPLVEVDAGGYATVDQELAKGSSYKIPGKYTVLDLDQSNGVWLAMVKLGDYNVWVDVNTATEIDANDAGTPVPAQYTPPATVTTTTNTPADVTAPDAPTTTASEPTEEPKDDKTTTNQAPAPTTPTATNTKPKEVTMAFSQDQQKQLLVATQSIQGTAADVAGSDGVQELVKEIPDKTKLIVYLVGDSLLGLGAIAPQLVVLLSHPEPFVLATTLSSVLATTGLFLLTMFGIYKSGK